MDSRKGSFKIKSQSQEGKWYELTFGDPNKMCRCECQDWQKWWLPCKHFVAVFNHYPCWQWENLSPLYKNSPFFSLDDELINKLQPSCSMAQPAAKMDVADESDISYNVNDEQEKNPLPLRRKYHRSEAAQCRDLLAQLRCATFLVQSPEALNTLRQTLSEALTDIRSHIQHEDGIEVETPQSKPKRKYEKCHDEKREELHNLPKAPKKAKYSRRHGKKARENKELTNVKIGIDKLLNLHTSPTPTEALPKGSEDSSKSWEKQDKVSEEEKEINLENEEEENEIKEKEENMGEDKKEKEEGQEERQE
jgi:hypothetical protein